MIVSKLRDENGEPLRCKDIPEILSHYYYCLNCGECYDNIPPFACLACGGVLEETIVYMPEEGCVECKIEHRIIENCLMKDEN